MPAPQKGGGPSLRLLVLHFAKARFRLGPVGPWGSTVDASILETLHLVATGAGQIVLDLYRAGSIAVDHKGPGDPVTAADRRANRFIVQRLHRAFPDVPIVAEESEATSFAGFRQAERVFFVDPLDGTREFIEGNGEFAVMIGLVEGPDALAGVVHAPVPGTTWMGAVGLGAWRLDPVADRRRPMRVSATTELAQARIVASRSHRSPSLESALARLGAREVRPMGSAGLKGAQIAEGLADAYLDTGGSTKRWDACAVDAVVTAAGGRMSDLAGAPIDYRGSSLANERGLVVSNGLMHDAVLARLASRASAVDTNRGSP